jgi:hypothetical protein
MSVAFCPKDNKELQDFLQPLSSKNATVIPPQGSTPCRQRLKRKGVAKPGVRRPDHPPKHLLGSGPAVEYLAHQKLPDSDERRNRKKARLERRRLAKCFFDEEADIRSDSGDEGEMRELANLEDDEVSNDSFINDSSQLGRLTQDELGRVDPTQNASSHTPASFDVHDDALHRRYDNERATRNQFATPMFNRKMQRNSLTPADAPESQRGLGRMHFVRSVLEHARQGGSTEEIGDQVEEVYNQLEEDEAAANEEESQAARKYHRNDDDGDDDDENRVQFDYGF